MEVLTPLPRSSARDFPARSIHDLSSFQSPNPKFGIVKNIATEHSSTATLNDLPIAIAYHCAASVFIKASMPVGVCHSMHNVSYCT